jgi:hypothetical protein
MTNFTQDNNTHKGQSSSSDLPRNIKSEDITTGTSGEARVFSFCGESNPVREAKAIIPQIQNKIVAEQLDKLLLTISKMIEFAQRKRPELGNIPALIAHIDEDGAVTVEWVFPDFRVGFNLEVNPADSGWYLVSNKKLNESTMSGQMKNMDTIIPTLLNFIVGNI